MKKVFLILAALGSCFVLSAADKIGPFSLDAGGRIEVGGLSFKLSHADSGWSWSDQQESTVTPEKGMPEVSSDRFRLEGVFRGRGGEFRLLETVAKTGEDSIAVTMSLESEKGVPCNELALCVALPHRDFVLGGIRIDGRKVGFRQEFDEEDWQLDAGGKESELVLPLQAGELTIRGNFRIHLQDDRKFGLNSWGVRLRNDPAAGVICKKEYRLTMTLRPYRFKTVSLKEAANLGFRDEVAGDGKGGWTDQGPNNDMRSFPVKQRNFAGVEFDVTDPEANGGKAVIGLFCDPHAPAYPKSARVAAGGAQGKYLYLLHALGWEPAVGTPVGTMKVLYQDGTSSEIELQSGRDAANFWQPRKRDNAVIGWRGENDSALIGISVSRFPIEKKPVKELTFTPSGQGIWLIAGISFSDDVVPVTDNDPLVMHANDDWKPLKSQKLVKSGSILDFSDLLDAPAGKYGFIRSVDGNFEFEKQPGKPVRFFGGNIAFDVNFMKNESCDKLAAVMAGMGYNILRLHHFDQVISKIEGKRSTSLDPKPLDRMDYMVSAMKKRGIYITLDLYILRQLAKGEVEELPDLAPGPDQFKALPFVSESAMRSWEAFSANLLNHVNPYTGLAWKDDPAIVTISLINEDTIFAVVDRDPRVRALYDAKFKEYVTRNRITLTDANRDRQWKIFLSETYTRGYLRMAKFLRSLGVRALLTDQNMWSNIPMSLLRKDYDLVDNHFYWQHPVFLGKNWSLPMSIGNRSVIAAYGGTLAEMFPSRLFGKPFTLTEWDFCNPSEYVCEGALLTGAYAGLQGWNGLCHFALAHGVGRVESEDSTLGLFDILNDPQRMLAERGAALFFLRGDVSAASTAYPLLVSETYLRDGNPVESNPIMVARLGLIGKVGTVVAPKDAPPALPAGTRAVLGLEPSWKTRISQPYFVAEDFDRLSEEMVRSGAVPAGLIDLKSRVYTSDTREITLDRKNNTFRVVTPRSEGFVIPEGMTLSGSYATIENRYSYGVFLAASRDGRPLAESRRVLILHLTDSKSSMSRYGTDDFSLVEDWGKLPLLLKRGEAVVTLKAPAGARLYACRVDGSRIGPVPFERVDGGIRFAAKNLAGEEPVLVYELVVE